MTICNKETSDMYYPELTTKVRYFKENEKGVETMCKVLEEKRNEAVEQDRITNAKEMLADGILTIEQIAKYSHLPEEKVRELAGEKGA